MDENGIEITEVFEAYPSKWYATMRVHLDWYVDEHEHHDYPNFIDIDLNRDELTKMRAIIDRRIAAMGNDSN